MESRYRYAPDEKKAINPIKTLSPFFATAVLEMVWRMTRPSLRHVGEIPTMQGMFQQRYVKRHEIWHNPAYYTTRHGFLRLSNCGAVWTLPDRSEY
jgi:hypothetical protein